MHRIINDVISKALCFGCGSCENICPTGAVKLKEDSNGFMTPTISSVNCIHCDLCDNTCPVLSSRQSENYEKKIYAVCADESVRSKSSSGGAFTVLSEYILSNNGYICGASFSEDYMSVKHILVSKKEDLWHLRGSKYLQSTIGTVYSEIKKYLDENKWVLFSGCPCQVDGLKHFLKKDYEKLITIDIICHGVPSPKVFRKYINEIAKNKKIINIDFREKAYWGWGTASSVFYEDGSIYRNDCFQDYYWRAFLGALSTRGACSSCVYANPINRSGDLTIGDFWGIGELAPELNDNKGISLLMINNSKGEYYLELIRSNFVTIREMDFYETVELSKRRNGQLIAPKSKHWAQRHFWDSLVNRSFSEAFEESINSKYDVGIVGWWYNENYGGALTYYALQQTLKDLGLTVLMIAKVRPNESYSPLYESIPYRFAQKYYCISKNYYKKDMAVLNKHCKTFISGSDQVFNPTLWEYSGPEYFLDFVDPENNIVSYASSFGNSYDLNNSHHTDIKQWLQRFNAISVREDYAVDICKQAFDLKAEKVLDPVFLCRTSAYEELINHSELKVKTPYILSFILDPEEWKRELILDVSSKVGLPYTNLINAIDFEKNIKKLGLDNTMSNIDIEDWLYYYKNAQFIITDSFHGTCFAIIFKKPFISIANKQRGENRFISLLSEIGLLGRMIYELNDVKKFDLFSPINYDEVYDKLTPKTNDSLNWLKAAVLSPHKSLKCKMKILVRYIKRLQKRITY